LAATGEAGAEAAQTQAHGKAEPVAKTAAVPRRVLGN
jgi:hypothetical protein